MSIIYSLTKPYAANPTTTTLLSIVGSGPPTNYIVKIFGTSDDTTNVMTHTVDASYQLTWNGVTYSGTNTLGVSPGSFSWVIVGNTAAFNFTPMAGAGAGNFGLHVVVIMSNTDSPAQLFT